MLRFIKYLFASFLGVFFALAIIFSAIIYLVSVSSDIKKKVVINENSVLVLNFSGQIVEHKEDNFLDAVDAVFNEKPQQQSLINLKKAIQSAKNDDKIKGLVLKFGNFNPGLATLEELYLAIQDFKTTEKFVYAYGAYLGERAFYLASLSDRTFITPEGILELNGFVVNKMFLKGLLDKYEIKAEVFKVGAFKSAVDPFLRTGISPEDKLQTETYLKDLYQHYLTGLNKSLKLSVDSLWSLSNNMSVRKASDALDYGLITDIGYKEDFENALKEILNLSEEDKVNYIKYKKYLKQVSTNYSSNKIALVVAQGTIVMSQNSYGQNEVIASNTLCKTLKKIRKDKDIKAVVLRINSPGGSALASDLIWNEIELLKLEKPVIASFGDYAASGGYYIAMNADVIVSQPNTITGSIGVFGLLFNLESFFNKNFGITFDQVQTNEFANIGNMLDDFSDGERQIIQNMVENTYETFTSKVAKGRNKDIKQIKKVAGGRVWTGNQALKIGLVDQLGSLDDAINLAAEKASIQDDFQIVIPSNEEDDFLNILKNLQTSWVENQMKNKLGPQYEIFKNIQNLNGVQARMPFITIE